MDYGELLRIVACPACHGELSLAENGDQTGFLCPCCQVVYPIIDEIPVLIQEEAIPMDKWKNGEGN